MRSRAASTSGTSRRTICPSSESLPGRSEAQRSTGHSSVDRCLKTICSECRSGQSCAHCTHPHRQGASCAIPRTSARAHVHYSSTSTGVADRSIRSFNRSPAGLPPFPMQRKQPGYVSRQRSVLRSLSSSLCLHAGDADAGLGWCPGRAELTPTRESCCHQKREPPARWWPKRGGLPPERNS